MVFDFFLFFQHFSIFVSCIGLCLLVHKPSDDLHHMIFKRLSVYSCLNRSFLARNISHFLQQINLMHNLIFVSDSAPAQHFWSNCVWTFFEDVNFILFLWITVILVPVFTCCITICYFQLFASKYLSSYEQFSLSSCGVLFWRKTFFNKYIKFMYCKEPYLCLFSLHNMLQTGWEIPS